MARFEAAGAHVEFTRSTVADHQVVDEWANRFWMMGPPTPTSQVVDEGDIDLARGEPDYLVEHRPRPACREIKPKEELKGLNTTAVRYGPRPPEAQVDHEIDAAKAPVATEAVTVASLTDPEIVAAVLPKPLKRRPNHWCGSALQRVRIGGRPPSSGPRCR